MKKFFAIAALTAGLGALAIPASAQDAYYGGVEYLQSGPSSYAPDGYMIQSDGMAAVGAQEMREELFDRKDDQHRQW